MFSQTAEYALRAIVHLAMNPGEPQTAQQIAVTTKVSAGYLSKVLQSLAREGIVTSQRGLHGGFALAIPPDRLTIYDVLKVVDPPERIHTCPLKLPGHGTRLCALHRKMDQAMEQVEQTLRSSTLADILTDTSTPSRPLCE